MITKNAIKRVAFIASILLSIKANAFQFRPTDAEWSAWPGYCQARYAVTAVGRNTKFVSLVREDDKAELAQWEAAGIVGIHHFCAGSIWLKRARFQDDPDRRQGMLQNGLEETAYALARSNKQSPFFVQLVIQQATIMFEDRNYGEALDILDTVQQTHPRDPVIYSAMAVMQRQLGHLEEAKETLLTGYRAVNGGSPEIAYNLGLICIELGQLDDAVRYAEEAYTSGFPLPGLRTKLEKLGRM